jgi:urease accessory protein
VALGFATRDGKTVLRHLHQQGSAKAHLPKTFEGGPPEAVLINLAGGITGGDRFRQVLHLAAGAHALVTNQAAEKIYKASVGATPALVRNEVRAEAHAIAEWLPQETIVFDGARLERRFEATLAESARLIAAEAMVFGRTAMGETVRQGYLRDHWRVRLGGRLVFADGLCLDGPIQTLLDRPAIARGNRALASVLYVGADAADLLEPAREVVADHTAPGRLAAVSRLGPVLLARFIAADGGLLRMMISGYIEQLRAAAGLAGGLPKLWRC